MKRLELAVGLEDSRAQGLNPIGGQVESSEALEGAEGIAGHLGDPVALEVELGQAREALERPEVGKSTDPVVAQIQEGQPLVVAENSRLDFSDLIVVSRWSLTDSNN